MAAYDDEEPPLDPAQERLRKKLVRLLFVSGGVMMLGLIAVFAAIVYKLGEGGERVAPPIAGDFAGASIDARLALPEGARIVSADLDGGHALVLVETADGRRSLVLVDLASGRMLGRYGTGAR